MKFIVVKIFILVWLILLGLNSCVDIGRHANGLFSFSSDDKYPIATALHQKGVDALGKKDTLLAERNFIESIRENENASSLFELAKIQLHRNTFYSRNQAYENFDRALMLEPGNLNYRYAYASLCKDFSRNRAFSEYRKILEIDSAQVNAWLELAELKTKDFDEYNKSVRATDEFFFNLQEYADEDFVEAEKYFLKAIQLDSTNRDVNLRLALLYETAGKVEKGIPLLQKLIKVKKGDKEIHLALGLLYYKISLLKESYQEYKIALDLMDKEEKEDFTYNSVKMLIDPAFKNITEEYDEFELREFIEMYWKVFDPLYLTDYNERLLEHYSRVAYSNLHFSVPKMKIVGWKSNRGEVVIRYGEPLSRMRIRPAMEGSNIQMKTEVWNFPDMVFGFTDMASSGNYEFSVPAGEKDKFKPQFSGDSNFLMENLRRLHYTGYEPKFEGPRFDVPFCFAQFKNEEMRNHTDFYISFGIEDDASIPPSGKNEDGYELGFTLFDKANYVELIKRRETISSLSRNIYKDDSLKTRHAQILKITSPSDSGIAAFEILRRKDKGVFSNHGQQTIRKFSNYNLDISDVIMATSVSGNGEGNNLVVRGEHKILPKPDRNFSKEDSLFLYYEVYNLKKDSNGLTDFDQTITIMKADDKNDFQKTISSIGEFLGLSGEEKVSLTTHYQTGENNPKIYMQLDLSKYERGKYSITVQIEDKIGKKSVSTNTIMDWRN